MKKVIFHIFFTLLLAFLFVNNTSAQLPTLASQSWKCMRGDEEAITFNGVANSTLSQELYADGYVINSTAYIVTCVGTQFGGVCTTGNSEYDRLIFNSDNTKTFPYPVTIEGGSKKQISLGKLKATATVTTQGLAGGLAFYGVTIGDDDLLVGKGEAQKLAVAPFSDQVTTKCATISWNTVFPPPPPPPPANDDDEDDGGRKLCKGCRWDPYGIVFDSQSLEPLPNIKITIFDKNKNIYSLPGLINPQTTKADGLFNFLVEPGIYYLSVLTPNNYKFISTPNIHPNYVKIYHKVDGSNSIYKPDEPIAEIIDTPEEAEIGKPNMEHRDIPLDPGANKPYEGEPSTIAYKIAREGIITKIDGKVSHPFTDITFSQSGNLIIKTKTDRFGFYETEFNNTDIDPDEDISVLYTKADLKTIDFIQIVSKPNSTFNFFANLIPEVQAQSTIRITSSKEAFKLSPIFPYIEGYAYDQNNKIQPNATVRIKLKMNNANIYETKADNNGYFKILPKNTPIFPYYLEIVPVGGGLISYTPSEFAGQNKKYLSENKINLAEGTKNDKPVVSGSPEPAQSDIDNTGRQDSTTTESKSVAEKKSVNSSILSLLLTIFVFFILIGATVFFIIKSRGSSPISPSRF
jgi:hypothetical protein